jgi:nitrite reductase (NADH) small subunit
LTRVSVGSADALEPGGRIGTTEGGRSIVVFNLDGELYALDASCGHKGGPLEDGVVRDGIVTCPWHLHRYDIRTGLRTDMPGIRQAVYPVVVEDDVIVVDVGDMPAATSIRDMLLEHARTWDRDA